LYFLHNIKHVEASVTGIQNSFQKNCAVERSRLLHPSNKISIMPYIYNDEKQINVKNTSVPELQPGLYLLWP